MNALANAIQFNQGDREMVAFAAPAKDIWAHFSTDRCVENEDEGYQRTLPPSRVRKSVGYVEGGNGLPLSIPVFIEAGRYSLSDKVLALNDEEDIGWIINGQHRVASARERGTEIRHRDPDLATSAPMSPSFFGPQERLPAQPEGRSSDRPYPGNGSGRATGIGCRSGSAVMKRAV